MRNAECTEITADGEMRITLPRAIMRAAGIEPGMPLVAYEEDGQIVVEMRPAAWTGMPALRGEPVGAEGLA
ncbi:AbrB/MazE/SpoVT family DNA-binding domain-containing protein [Saccharopolyspora sp. NPDC000359]|uniref:AbrB/MazE/SpoVT family DNA-binding domain-containing protein n=1 Tax=Saccharopolyspora sp. NPDC000359 TaxID=3154251 RepID=UPI0033244064